MGEAPGQPSLPRVGSALVSPLDMSHYGRHVTSPHLCWGLLREPSGMASEVGNSHILMSLTCSVTCLRSLADIYVVTDKPV